MLQVIAALDKLRVEPLPKLWVARRIAGAQIVHRLHQSNSEEVFPDAVHHRSAKLRVLRIGHPLGQLLARIRSRLKHQRLMIQRLRCHRLLRTRLRHRRHLQGHLLQLKASLVHLLHLFRHLLAGLLHFRSLGLRHGVGRLRQTLLCFGDALELLLLLPRADVEDGRPFVRFRALHLHLRKERGEVIEIVLRVFLERMIMAARAADAGAEERLRDGIGRFALLHVSFLAQVVDEISNLRMFRHAPARGKNIARQGIPWLVASHPSAQPRVKRTHAFHPAHIVIALLPILQQVRQLERPVIHELRRGEQPLHQLRTLVLGRVREKGANLSGTRQRASDIQRRAAQEGGVIALR